MGMWSSSRVWKKTRPSGAAKRGNVVRLDAAVVQFPVPRYRERKREAHRSALITDGQPQIQDGMLTHSTLEKSADDRLGNGHPRSVQRVGATHHSTHAG